MAARVTGLRQAVRALERYGVSTQDLKAAFGRISSLVVSTALGRVTRVTGDLAGSVRPSKTKNKAVVRAGGARVPYAGRHNYTVDPFLTDAADQHEKDAIALMQDELRRLAAGLNL